MPNWRPTFRLPTRRQFLRRTWQTAAGLALAGGATVAYGAWEAGRLQVRRETVSIPNLPPSFVGKTICVLTDLHLGPFVSIEYIRWAVQQANSLQPDLFALVGDFVHKGHLAKQHMPACLAELANLQAPLGAFAVPGNHDLHKAGEVYRNCIRDTPLIDLTNTHAPVNSNGDCLYLAGVDDHWWGKPDQDAALDGVPKDAAVILLSHNPDFAEEHPNERVGLVLSGHTHGGQVMIPGDGGYWIPSRYGDKYRAGIVHGPASQVYVSRGVGLTGVPCRINCPPEINLLTLAVARD